MIKGAKSIAEYAIRKWMEQEGFAIECFHAEMTGQHEALVRDCNGDSLRLVYDPAARMVFQADT